MSQRGKSIKILLFGILSQAITLLLGIIIPKLVIVSYGSEVNGLLSSVKEIFIYVALLEAGIGTAALQAMYAPIATNDKKHLSEIVAATGRYYTRTGIYYAIAVVLLAVAYPLVIKSDVPTFTIAAVILLRGGSGVINYLFQGKLTLLLRADRKKYITTNVATIANVLAHTMQIVLILAGFDVIMVQLAYFIINVLQMIFIALYVKKHYGWLDRTAKPDYAALKQSRYVIIHQISTLIFNNTDTLILSYFWGLKVASVYTLYSTVIACVNNIVNEVCGSVEFVLGQTFNSDRKRFLRLQEVYETYYLGLSFCMFTVTLVMLPSFIVIYTRGVTDITYTDKWLPYLFVAVNLLKSARRSSNQVINFGQHFKQTQWRAVLESVINLTVSLFCVVRFGIYGVLFGTIAALLYRTNDMIIYANRRILDRSPFKTYRRWFVNTAVMILCTAVAKQLVPEVIGGYLRWAVIALAVAVPSGIVFLIADSLVDRDCYTLARREIRLLGKKALKKLGIAK
ncbi:MAG: sugar isomerase [Clostridia bacterium]|nr:sugar isomerase [Clostridia bacterium]